MSDRKGKTKKRGLFLEDGGLYLLSSVLRQVIELWGGGYDLVPKTFKDSDLSEILSGMTHLIVHIPSPDRDQVCLECLVDLAVRCRTCPTLFLSYRKLKSLSHIDEIFPLTSENLLILPEEFYALGKRLSSTPILSQKDTKLSEYTAKFFKYRSESHHEHIERDSHGEPEKRLYTFMLVDDDLGFGTHPGYLEGRIKDALKENKTLKGVSVCVKGESNLDRAVHRIQTELIDLLILDLQFNLPGGEWRNAAEILKEKIRPFDPALPVVILTGTSENDILWANEYGGPPCNAAYFEKSKFLTKGKDSLVDEAFQSFAELLFKKIIELETLKDRIETEADRREEVLSAHSRDFMQTRLLYELKRALRDGTSFSLAFLDVDGMKALNTAIGYHRTNQVIIRVCEKIDGFLKNRFKKVKRKGFLGRFFRERGDEFLLLLPCNKEKTLKCLRELREKIGSESVQEYLLGEARKRYRLKVSMSYGLVCYPDDLANATKLQVKKWKKLSLEKKSELVKRLVQEVTDVAVRLKESAKILGKDQICGYLPLPPRLKDHLIKLPQVKADSLRVRVGIFGGESDPKEGLRIQSLLRLFTGQRTLEGENDFEHDLLFDYEILPSSCLDEHITNLDLLVFGPRFDLNLLPRNRSPKVVISSSSEYPSSSPSKKEEQDLTYVVPDPEILKFGSLWVLPRPQQAETIRQIKVLRDLWKHLFGLLKKATVEAGNFCYFPRFEVQRALHGAFGNIKREIMVYTGEGSWESEGKDKKKDEIWVEQAYEGLKIAEPEQIWVAERVSNKTGKPRYAVVIPLLVTTEDAYAFLYQDSAKNFTKLQNFYDGFLKGLMQTDLDRERVKEVIDLLYDVDAPQRLQVEGERQFVCRLPTVPPVDPRAYTVLVRPDRVRLDVKVEF